MPPGLLSVVGSGFRIEPFQPGRHFIEQCPLLGAQPVPNIQVDQHGQVYLVEPGIDPVLGHLVPPKIEDALDGPAVTIDDPPFQRRIYFPRIRAEHRGPHVDKEGTVDGRHADLEATEIGFIDGPGQIEVKGDAVPLPHQVMGIDPFVVQLLDVIPTPVLVQFGVGALDQLQRVSLGQQIGIVSP